MKKIFLSVDIEEWYHLDYFKNYKDVNKKIETIPDIYNFLNVLDELNIKCTFFTLGESALKFPEIIKELSAKGHEIACHGLDHELLYNKSNENFKYEVKKAKEILEDISPNIKIQGYRASCFSMDREKLDILKEIGYSYDSSYISFAEHPLYGKLDMTGFTRSQSLIHKNDHFYEFEIPTYKIGKYNIPISGGGYLRLFPFWLNNYFIKDYLKKNENFIFYLHPFELTDKKIEFPKEAKKSEIFRASVGRKNNLKKLKKILMSLKKDSVEFTTFSEEVTRNG